MRQLRNKWKFEIIECSVSHQCTTVGIKGCVSRTLILNIKFGSIAEDRATAFSDADILIVVSQCDRRFVDRAELFRTYFDDLGIKTDLFVYTESEIERTTLAQKALSNTTLQFARDT